jgi:hypothetical protein
MRRILSRVSLIACRGIGTILMYELDTTNNTNFFPSIIFEVSVEPASTQREKNNIIENTATGIVQDARDIKKNALTNNNNSMLENKLFKTNISPEVIKEKFESHRTLLLEEDGLF